jgi:hypothetical protein
MSIADEGVTLRQIRVQVVENRQTGLLVALSDDLKGLMLAARTEGQIEEELPGAIREMLEAAGHNVLSVTTEPDPKGLPSEFSSSILIASARLAA